MEISDASQICIVDKLYTNPGVVTVYKGYIVSDPSREVAVKEMYFSSPQEAALLINEAYSMQAYSHPHLIRVLGMYLSEDAKSFSIVTDFYSMGDLNKEIRRRQDTRQFWTDGELYCLFRQLISAHAYLQREGVAHRDVKPHDIFLSMENGQIKLTVADLGCATQNHDRSAITIIGTPLYLSPILRQAYVSNQLQHTSNYIQHDIFKSDAYSLGLTMLYMASLQDLNDLTVLNNLQALINVRIVRLANLPWTQQIINTMLQVDEEIRWDFVQIQRYFFPDDCPEKEIETFTFNQNKGKETFPQECTFNPEKNANLETTIMNAEDSDYQDGNITAKWTNNQQEELPSQLSKGERKDITNPNYSNQQFPDPHRDQNPNSAFSSLIQGVQSFSACVLCEKNPPEPFTMCSHDFVCKECKKNASKNLFELIDQKLEGTEFGICALCLEG